MARTFHPGMGQAVAERTILRRLPDGEWESWGHVAHRVATGNASLCPDQEDVIGEFSELKRFIGDGTILMSGRHLQHGDINQSSRNMEVFTNCATASSSFMSFYLLLNGSGVGRSYDDAMMLVDWDQMPAVRCVLDQNHADFDYSAHESVRDAKHKYGEPSETVIWHTVEDTREGWAKALELVEVMAWKADQSHKLVIIDFSQVREKGRAIKGMQGRPSSGPVPTMNAFSKMATIRGGGLPRWKQALYIDHYFAESVLVGGARRAARMATKTWRDASVIEFIQSKRPIEFAGKTPEEIAAIRSDSAPQSFLWSANMSIMVDDEFWTEIKRWHGRDGFWLENSTTRIFTAATKAAYGDGTGEPGFINVDKLKHSTEGIDKLNGWGMTGSKKYPAESATRSYLNSLFEKAKTLKHWMIVNPCGEKCLALWGAFCVIADVVPFHANSIDDAEQAMRVTTRALIRVNLMDSVYRAEVERTNRIGVGMTGIFEFAWQFFGFGFLDLIDETKSVEFWRTIARFKRAVQDEARSYSEKLGVNVPDTDTTIKPAGTTSKLFGLTEGVHLPAMAQYVRWVQFRSDDPLIEKYRQSGYQVRELKTYQGTSIVGFPTELVISTLGMGEKLITAGQATPEQQYQWLMLLEKYWIRGVDEDGNPLIHDTGSQISYTLKYDPKVVSYADFVATLIKNQPNVKCCSVMPQEDRSSYEYLPEEQVTKAEFEAMSAAIREVVEEDVDQVHVECAGGACPIDFAK